jgi:hypothetical protein
MENKKDGKNLVSFTGNRNWDIAIIVFVVATLVICITLAAISINNDNEDDDIDFERIADMIDGILIGKKNKAHLKDVAYNAYITKNDMFNQMNDQKNELREEFYKELKAELETVVANAQNELDQKLNVTSAQDEYVSIDAAQSALTTLQGNSSTVISTTQTNQTFTENMQLLVDQVSQNMADIASNTDTTNTMFDGTANLNINDLFVSGSLNNHSGQIQDVSVDPVTTCDDNQIENTDIVGYIAANEQSGTQIVETITGHIYTVTDNWIDVNLTGSTSLATTVSLKNFPIRFFNTNGCTISAWCFRISNFTKELFRITSNDSTIMNVTSDSVSCSANIFSDPTYDSAGVESILSASSIMNFDTSTSLTPLDYIWFHVAVTLVYNLQTEQLQVTLYVNGVSAGSYQYVQKTISNDLRTSSYLELMSDMDTSCQGIAAYNNELTTTQIQTLFDYTKCPGTSDLGDTFQTSDCGLIPNNIADAVSPNMLIAYAKVDEGSGGSIVDSVSSSVVTFDTDDFTWRSSGGLKANHNDRGLSLTNYFNGYDIFDSSWTISCLTYHGSNAGSGTGHNYYFTMGTKSDYNQFEIKVIQDTSIRCTVYKNEGDDAYYTESLVSKTLNTWTHMACTFVFDDVNNTMSVRMFVNGSTTTTEPLVVNTSKGSNGFKCNWLQTTDISGSRISIHHYALNAAEIQNLYQGVNCSY